MSSSSSSSPPKQTVPIDLLDDEHDQNIDNINDVNVNGTNDAETGGREQEEEQPPPPPPPSPKKSKTATKSSDSNNTKKKSSSPKDDSNNKKDSTKKKKKGKTKRERERDKRREREANRGSHGPDGEEVKKHKYSTADLKPSWSKCKKFCLLLLMFLIIIAIMIGMSKLMEHFFFGKQSDNSDLSNLVHDDNSSFPLDKSEVDSACSRGSFANDDGATCHNVCMPVFTECCDPFNEFNIYANYSTLPPTNNNSTGATNTDDLFVSGTGPGGTAAPTPTNTLYVLSKPPTNVGGNTTFNGSSTNNTGSTRYLREAMSRLLQQSDSTNDSNFTNSYDSNGNSIPQTIAPVYWNEELAKMDAEQKARENMTCALDNELAGCVRYAKCQALTKKVDAAPSTLEDMCSLDQLKIDPGSCQSICDQSAACCYATDETNCVASEFDRCLDYAPCQNLRSLKNVQGLVPSAPRSLDHDCYYQQQACLDNCTIAECCGNRNSFCFSNNFISCLTYAPCNNITSTSIHVPKQFNYVDKPPNELLSACNPAQTTVVMPGGSMPCTDLCSTVACCWASDLNQNCFMDDPLGCLAWMDQCQILLKYPNM